MQVNIDRLVNRLVTHTHLWVMGEVSPKPMTDLPG